MKAVVFSLSALALAGCSREAAPIRPAADAAPAIMVATAPVVEEVTARRQPVTGTVRPAERATVAARVMGRVARIHVPIGGKVRAGEPLVTLEAAELEARLQQARAQLAQIERELARESSLVDKGASSAEAARTLADRRRAAAAAVEEAATLHSYAVPVAPFDGVVTARHREEGDLAVAGSPLLEIEGSRLLRADVQVPASLETPAPGASLDVQIGERRVPGRLAELSPAADPVSRTRLARLDLPTDSGATSGQFVRVLWPAGERRVLTVPASAVTRFGQMEQVWVVSEGRVHLRLVRTGARDGDRVEVLAGAGVGEEVVVSSKSSFRDGQIVQVTP